MRVYDVFAFYHRDPDGSRDQYRRGVPEWKLPLVASWIAHHDFDDCLITRSDGKPSSTELVTHHVCSDSVCPGGCE